MHENAHSSTSPEPARAIASAVPAPKRTVPARLREVRSAAESDARRNGARWARLLHGWLLFAIAANLIVFGATPGPLGQRLLTAAVAGSTFLLAFRMERRSGSFARLSGLAQMVYRIRAVLLGVVALSSLAYLLPFLTLSPQRVLTIALTIIVVSTLWSLLTRQLLGARNVHRVLLIGEGERVRRFVSEFDQDPHPSYELVGTLSGTSDTVCPAGELEHLGSIHDLETVLAAEAVDTVVVAVEKDRLELFSRLSAYNHSSGITVQELPGFSEHVFGRVPVDVINAAWFMHMIHPFYQPYSRLAKRVGDVLAAAFIGLIALPFLPLVALLVKLTSSGPVLFRQTRVGEHGEEFSIYKFRSMRTDAEADGKARWAGKNDDRVTGFGRFIRATRIDELPQLWNVLTGHMSFVGPRPERPEFVTELEHVIPYYQRRHIVKPGITGWAQVRLGYSDSIDGAADKLGFELYYLKHRSLFFDFVIFVETVRVVLLRWGSR